MRLLNLCQRLPLIGLISILCSCSSLHALEQHCPTDQETASQSGLATVLASYPAAEAATADFYRRCNNQAAWIAHGVPTPQARELQGILANAMMYGLEPGDYSLPPQGSGFRSMQDLVRFELALSSAALAFAHDLRCGRLTPQQAKADIQDTCRDVDLASFVWQLSRSSTVVKDLEALEPNAPGYQRTKRALALWTAFSSRPIPALPPWTKTIDLSDATVRSAVVARLQMEGDLASAAGNDALPEAFSSAIRSFQTRHGLPANSNIDAATYQALSIPVSTRQMQLALTLERWRWIAREFTNSPVVVNIPEFRLRAYDRSLNVQLSARVIVGGAYRRQTPVFQNSISAIDFRPYWNVPPSIQRNELAPAIRKDPGYLSRHNYEIVRGENGSTRIRQKPGEQNALGLIRFSLPNTHNVYLHDTPKPELFERVRRDFSHGCIRVENPARLAEWMLRDQMDGWDQNTILDAMHGSRSFTIHLSNPHPVLIVYGTGFAAEDGKTYFLPDIYGEDRRLSELLRQVSAARRVRNLELSRVLDTISQ